MARITSTEKTEVVQKGFVVEWPEELLFKPVAEVKLSEKVTAKVYKDPEIDEFKRSYVVFTEGDESYYIHGNRYDTLFNVYASLQNHADRLNVKSRKTTRTCQRED